ncbi:MAG: hypothetical protein WC389_20130 [Lutibacter sp.]|jgi:hypothetical protein
MSDVKRVKPRFLSAAREAKLQQEPVAREKRTDFFSDLELRKIFVRVLQQSIAEFNSKIRQKEQQTIKNKM